MRVWIIVAQNFSNLVLILGGARSGKSEFAEKLTAALGPDRIYLATGFAGDAEMADRIASHKQRRGTGWHTREAQIDLKPHLLGNAPVLLDCLTMWLSNVMSADGDVDAATDDLISAIAACPGTVVAVSNEVGMGLVPETPLGRSFRDAQGRLNQAFARKANAVAFVAAGLPIWLKGSAP